MSTDQTGTGGIRTLSELEDFIITTANQKSDWVTSDFLSLVHDKILKAFLRAHGNDQVATAYFRIASMLTTRKTYATKIVESTKATIQWMR